MIKLKEILNEKSSLASWSDDKKLLRWKVYIDGEKEPLILTGRSANEVKKFAHQMIKNNKVKIKKVVKEEKLNEVNFEKVKLPPNVDRFLIKLVDSVKDTGLNRIKRSALLYKVIDAMGMSPQTLMADIQKIKKELGE